MSAVDVSTGLPELPEGKFWRVRHPSIKEPEHSHIAFGPAYWAVDRSKLQVSVVKRETRERNVTRGRLWWKRTEVFREEREFETAKRECEGTQPEDILAAAIALLEQLAEQDRINSLLGSYPPMSLAVVPSD